MFCVACFFCVCGLLLVAGWCLLLFIGRCSLFIVSCLLMSGVVVRCVPFDCR